MAKWRFLREQERYPIIIAFDRIRLIASKLRIVYVTLLLAISKGSCHVSTMLSLMISLYFGTTILLKRITKVNRVPIETSSQASGALSRRILLQVCGGSALPGCKRLLVFHLIMQYLLQINRIKWQQH